GDAPGTAARPGASGSRILGPSPGSDRSWVVRSPSRAPASSPDCSGSLVTRAAPALLRRLAGRDRAAADGGRLHVKRGAAADAPLVPHRPAAPERRITSGCTML